MKNIVYLIKSTRNHLTPFPQCRVGITNYLYRQLLIHNHKWLPRDKERQRPPSPDTPRKLGWQPMAVITGFPNEQDSLMFLSLFNRNFEDLKVGPNEFMQWKYRYEIDQRDYRLQQLALVCREFDDQMSERVLRDRLNSSQSSSELGGVTRRSKLTIHWDSIGDIDRLLLKFPASINHISGINVSSIDKMCFDAQDADDDRNIARLKQDRILKERQAKLAAVARELNIPVDDIQQVLHHSRMEMREKLTSNSTGSTSVLRSKRGKKAAERVVVYPAIPKQVDLSADALSSIPDDLMRDPWKLKSLEQQEQEEQHLQQQQQQN